MMPDLLSHAVQHERAERAQSHVASADVQREKPTPMRLIPPVITRFVRSFLVGGAATLSDLATLALCIYALGMDEQLASFPALAAGALLQFYGNRHFAFRAGSGCVKRQAMAFLVVEAITLALNALAYYLMLKHAPPLPVGAGETNLSPMLVRLVSTNLVFLCWSFPAWHWVFRLPTKRTPETGKFA